MRGHAVVLAAVLAWFIPIGSAEAKLDILVDKVTQRMLVIQDGYIRYMWPVSTGRDNMATPNGVYAPQRLERNWFSTAYYNSPMPFSIFFHNGYAIHGSYAIDRLGGPASHGCVRLHPHHAAILFDLVQQEGPGNTKIEITEQGAPEERSLPGREMVGPPPRDIPGIPPRDIGGVPPRDIGGVPPRDIGGVPPRDIGGVPPRDIGGVPPRDMGGVPPRQIGAAQGEPPPVPRVIRYRDAGEMPEPMPAQRGNPQIAARNGAPPPLRAAPPARRLLAYAKPPSTAPRAPGATAMADTANSPPRLPKESLDSRPKLRIEAPRATEAPRVAEGSPPEPAPPAASASNVKLLPASCWSGGASRWKWWASSGGANPCK